MAESHNANSKPKRTLCLQGMLLITKGQMPNVQTNTREQTTSTNG